MSVICEITLEGFASEHLLLCLGASIFLSTGPFLLDLKKSSSLFAKSLLDPVNASCISTGGSCVTKTCLCLHSHCQYSP